MKSSIIIKIFNLSRPVKRTIQVVSDSTLIALCFWMAMALRLQGIYTKIEFESWLVLATVIPVTVFAFARLGLYRSVVRYMAERAFTVIIIGAGISAATMFGTSQYFELGIPRSVPGIYFSLFVLATGSTRLGMRLVHLAARDAGRTPVVIYGANEAGRHLMRSLQESRNYRPYFFIDNSPQLQGTNISGLPVMNLENAKKKLENQAPVVALIAIGSENLTLQRQASKEMTDLGLEVRLMPKMSDLISGRVKITNLRKIKIDELLGRDPVQPLPELMSSTTSGLSVMVTGAGGSIGSELCRQIIRLAPKRLVLLEISEYALYSTIEELDATNKEFNYGVELVPILGSVTQNNVTTLAISENSVQTIFHAAAYKHVPLVENNAVEAVRNNILGTLITAQTAGQLGVKNFTLISTDKAVRPTNIMGATKRLAELVIKDMAEEYPSTNFCSVRFGNVLGSSGSVVPKFEKQILKGGPLTLTHPEITRYFMSIQEAAQLVIQSSAMAKGGEVFLLDMGKPIRIIDLARTMCSLHGKFLQTDEMKLPPEQNSIQLKITGLRPGEKLYEELLVSGTEVSTLHPRIKCDNSRSTQDINIQAVINQCLGLRSNTEVAEALAILPIEYTKDFRHTDQVCDN